VFVAKYEVSSCVSLRCGLDFTAFNISCIIYCMKQTHLWEINGVAQIVQKLPSFMTFHCSLPCSQEHATKPYSLLLESNQRLHTLFTFHFNIILSATSRCCKWSLFPCGFPNRNLCLCHCSQGYYTLTCYYTLTWLLYAHMLLYAHILLYAYMITICSHVTIRSHVISSHVTIG
jgi:hypothetical protein